MGHTFRMNARLDKAMNFLGTVPHNAKTKNKKKTSVWGF